MCIADLPFPIPYQERHHVGIRVLMDGILKKKAFQHTIASVWMRH